MREKNNKKWLKRDQNIGNKWNKNTITRGEKKAEKGKNMDKRLKKGTKQME